MGTISTDRPFGFFIRVLNPAKPGYTASEHLAVVLKTVCRKFGMELLDARDFNSTGRISEQVLRALSDADVVFGDANEANENVWYEIGYAHCVNAKKVVYLFEKGRTLPFDIADFRGVEYTADVTAQRKLEVTLGQMLRSILAHSALVRLLRGEHWDTAVPEYVSTRPALKKPFQQTLRDLSLNIDLAPELRRRALYALVEVGYVDNDLNERLSNPLVEESIRQALFDKLAQTDAEVSPSVWQNGLAEKTRFPVLTSLARAAAAHWAKGRMDDDYFVANFVKHSAWVVRKHLTITLLELGTKKTCAALRLLADDHRDEITYRFIEWLDRKAAQKTPMSDVDRTVLTILKTAWRTRKTEAIVERKSLVSRLLREKHRTRKSTVRLRHP